MPKRTYWDSLGPPSLEPSPRFHHHRTCHAKWKGHKKHTGNQRILFYCVVQLCISTQCVCIAANSKNVKPYCNHLPAILTPANEQKQSSQFASLMPDCFSTKQSHLWNLRTITHTTIMNNPFLLHPWLTASVFTKAHENAIAQGGLLPPP